MCHYVRGYFYLVTFGSSNLLSYICTMKEQILQLGAEGKTYKEIHEILGCSKSKISYYLGKGVKERTIERNKKAKKTARYILASKIDFFISRSDYKGFNYQKRDESVEAYHDKVNNSPYCYLTGRKIDLEDSSSYHLDHKIPYHISKDNSVDNMELACRDANQSKAHMTLGEYIALCKEVLEHNGYKVIPPEK